MSRRVIVTRPAGQAAGWMQALREAGLDALSLPLIAIAAPADTHALQAAWAQLNRYDALMFVSANAVQHFFEAGPTGQGAFFSDNPKTLRAFATGPGTVAALQSWGVASTQIDAPSAHAGQFDSEALWEVVKARIGAGSRVLIVRGMQATEVADGQDTDAAALQGAGRDWFAQQLEQAGAVAEFVVAYQRSAPVPGLNAMALMQLSAHDGSVWLFSSSEAVVNLGRICPAQDWTRAIALATHPRIAAAARAAGFGTVLESNPSLPSLLASIESLP